MGGSLKARVRHLRQMGRHHHQRQAPNGEVHPTCLQFALRLVQLCMADAAVLRGRAIPRAALQDNRLLAGPTLAVGPCGAGLTSHRVVAVAAAAPIVDVHANHSVVLRRRRRNQVGAANLEAFLAHASQKVEAAGHPVAHANPLEGPHHLRILAVLRDRAPAACCDCDAHPRAAAFDAGVHAVTRPFGGGVGYPIARKSP